MVGPCVNEFHMLNKTKDMNQHHDLLLLFSVMSQLDVLHTYINAIYTKK